MGYFSGLNRATGAISIWTHDRSDDKGKGGFMDGIGIKTALSVDKFHVDMLGRLYPVKQETRQPLASKRGVAPPQSSSTSACIPQGSVQE